MATITAPIHVEEAVWTVSSMDVLVRYLTQKGYPPGSALKRMCRWLVKRLRDPRSWQIPTVLVCADCSCCLGAGALSRLLAQGLWVSRTDGHPPVRRLQVACTRQYRRPDLAVGVPLVVQINAPDRVHPALVTDLPRWSFLDPGHGPPGRQVLVVINAHVIHEDCLAIADECRWLGVLGRRRYPHRLRALVRERFPMIHDLLDRHAFVLCGSNREGVSRDDLTRDQIVAHMVESYACDLAHPEIPGLGPVPTIQHLLRYLLAVFAGERIGLIDTLVTIMARDGHSDETTLAAHLLALLVNTLPLPPTAA